MCIKGKREKERTVGYGVRTGELHRSKAHVCFDSHHSLFIIHHHHSSFIIIIHHSSYIIIIYSVDGQDKQGGITHLTVIPPTQSFSLTNQFTAYSHLIFTPSSPLGDYQPFHVPVFDSIESKPATVNSIVAAGEDLEQALEAIIHSVDRVLHIPSRRQLSRIILSQSVDVEMTSRESNYKLTIRSGMTFTNNTQIPMLVRCWLGDKLVFTAILKEFGNCIAYPYASHIPILQMQFIPLTSNSELQRGTELLNETEKKLDGFVFSAIDVAGRGLSEINNVFYSYREDICEWDEDQKEICAEMDELPFVLSASKKQNGRYSIIISPLITIQNCLPLPLAVNCEKEMAPLPLFADTCTKMADRCYLLQPLDVLPIYSHLSHRYLALTPAHMRCDQSAPLRSLCEDWLPWLEEGIVKRPTSLSSSSSNSLLETEEEDEMEEEETMLPSSSQSLQTADKATTATATTSQASFSMHRETRRSSHTHSTSHHPHSQRNSHSFALDQGNEKKDDELVLINKVKDVFIECCDYDNVPVSVTCRCEWRDGHLVISVFVPFWLDLPSSIPIQAQVFTSKDKDSPLPNQHFLQSEDALIQYYSNAIAEKETRSSSFISPPSTATSDGEGSENRVLLIDGKHVSNLTYFIAILYILAIPVLLHTNILHVFLHSLTHSLSASPISYYHSH